MELHVAFTISLIGAIVLTAIAYPAIVWLVCKLHRNELTREHVEC
jgi:hypothetical protein